MEYNPEQTADLDYRGPNLTIRTPEQNCMVELDHTSSMPLVKQSSYFAIGRQFSEEGTHKMAPLDDADIPELDPRMTSNQQLQALPFLLTPSFNAPGNSPGHREGRLAAGLHSSHTSNNSDADGSVIDGRFLCQEPGCAKTFKTENGLR